MKMAGKLVNVCVLCKYSVGENAFQLTTVSKIYRVTDIIKCVA